MKLKVNNKEVKDPFVRVVAAIILALIFPLIIIAMLPILLVAAITNGRK